MSDDQVKKLPADETPEIEASKTESLPDGEELANKVLEESKQEQLEDGADEKQLEEGEKNEESEEKKDDYAVEVDEVAQSDQLAETLNSLQGLIERHANKLQEMKNELKEKRDSMKNIFSNDSTLAEAQDAAATHTQVVKERRSQLQSNPEVINLKVDISELREQQKEIEETLSNHLVNYHSMTNSTSFDTSDGDQWDFSIRAKIKPKKIKS